MARSLIVRSESWPIKGSFRISRGAKTEAEVVVVEISENGITGRGEGDPYPRYGEAVQSVVGQIETLRSEIANGLTRQDLQQRLPAGAARNALDCALIDLEAKASGRPAHAILNLPPPRPQRTAFTLSLGTPEAMGAAAKAAADRSFSLLKLKVGGADDLARVEAVRNAAPQVRLIADANEGWAPDELFRLAPELARLGVALLEQPLKAGDDEALRNYRSPVPLCADESCHTRADLPRILGRYSHINVKLDKTGGLTEAAALIQEAATQGLRLMVGCMVSTSLAMAPAMLLTNGADFVDLDGPLLLLRDREPGVVYDRDMILPPTRALWG